jgi:hypothetical protein
MVRRAVGLALCLVIAACGGGSGDDTAARTSSEVIVTSADGRARLRVPAGAMPADVTVGITAAAVPNALVVDATEVVVYDLEPVGLAFDVPATLTVSFPVEAEPGIPLALVAVGDDPGSLEEVPAEALLIGEELVVEAEISHFSMAVVWVHEDRIAIDVDCAEEMALAETCSMSIVDPDRHGQVDYSFYAASGAYQVIDSSATSALFECVSEQALGRAQGVRASARFADLDYLYVVVGFASDALNDGHYVHRSACEAADSIVPELSTLVVDIGNNTYSVTVPNRAAVGSEVEAKVCGTDASYAPLIGNGYLSLTPTGDPGDANALHDNAPFGPDGCVIIVVTLPGDALTGTWAVWTFDEASDTAARAGEMEVAPGQ